MSVPGPDSVKGLRIGLVGSRGYPSTYGGFETLIRHLAPYLFERGAEVTVYSHGASRIRTRAIQVDGINVVATPGIESKAASTLTHGLTASLHAAKAGLDVALVLNVAHGFYLPWLHHRGVPHAVNVDGIEWERAKWGRIARAVFLGGAKLTARVADEIIVDSRAIGSRWQEMFGRSGQFIPYGADVVNIPAGERLEQLEVEPGRYALMVARLVPENNVHAFLDAIELSEDISAVVVGSSNYRNSLQDRLIELEKTRARFHWLGHIDDQEWLLELWSNAGVYFHGHSVGGTNPALLQALGCGAPTVAARTAYNCEVIGRDAGIAVSATGRDIAEAFEAVLTDAPLRRALSTAARDRVRTAYAWDDVCGRYAKVLANVALLRSSRDASCERWAL